MLGELTLPVQVQPARASDQAPRSCRKRNTIVSTWAKCDGLQLSTPALASSAWQRAYLIDARPAARPRFWSLAELRAPSKTAGRPSFSLSGRSRLRTDKTLCGYAICGMAAGSRPGSWPRPKRSLAGTGAEHTGSGPNWRPPAIQIAKA